MLNCRLLMHREFIAYSRGEASRVEMNSRCINKRQFNVFKPREQKTEWKKTFFTCEFYLLHSIYCTSFIAYYLLHSLEGIIYCTLDLLNSFTVRTSGLKTKHRGEAVLRINCDTLDTFRTKECKETIETAKIIKIQQKRKTSVKFARFNI